MQLFRLLGSSFNTFLSGITFKYAVFRTLYIFEYIFRNIPMKWKSTFQCNFFGISSRLMLCLFTEER